ncbi:2-C-methyl-D-erythritol 4-phosphate cytidylyltransferase [Amylibacter sp. SFDW26]|uniref:2-C-methyl-D-erythritol 4-phosphate cytidylyltransferase n=1 Tax=Amylibacter sp. SFDW26 TaxID=2652722 RepID=UPI00351A1DBF
MKRTGLIVAAGRGTRAGGGLPKQYRPLAGIPILTHTIKALLASDRITEVRVVINPDDQVHYAACVEMINDARLQTPSIGGNTRSASVLNGLQACKGEQVFIHDGARPLLPYDALNRIIDALDTDKAAFLALPVTDALWHVANGKAQDAQKRDTLWRGQTPQAFYTADIIAAHENAKEPADDDVAMARAAGLDVTPILGSELNLKITQPEDFDLAERLIG